MNTNVRRAAPAQTADGGMTLLDWRPHRRGPLRGYAEIELSCGLVLDAVPVFLGDDGVARGVLPRHPRVESGRVATFEGEIVYTSDLRWRTRELGQRWRDAVGVLVRREYPEDLDR